LVRTAELPFLFVVDVHGPGLSAPVPPWNDEFTLELVGGSDEQVVLRITEAIEKHPVRISFAVAGCALRSLAGAGLGHATGLFSDLLRSRGFDLRGELFEPLLSLAGFAFART